MKALVKRFPVLTLVALVLGFQLTIVLIAASLMPPGKRMHDIPDAHAVFRLRVFWPLIFAVLVTYYIEGKAGLKTLFASYTVWRIPKRFYALAFTWKFLFCYLAWAIADLIGWIPWPGAIIHNFFGGTWSGLLGLVATMPFILGIALVEETTWMKFCVTRLQEKYTAFVACGLTGVAWGLWYLPMLLLHEGVPDGVPWYMFLLSMIGLTLLLGWVFNMTRSGLVLFIMQVVSNIAFFVMPALPTWHNMDAEYVIAFIWVEVSIVALLVLWYGPKELGVGKRPTWSEGKEESRAYEAPELRRQEAVLAD